RGIHQGARAEFVGGVYGSARLHQAPDQRGIPVPESVEQFLAGRRAPPSAETCSSRQESGQSNSIQSCLLNPACDLHLPMTISTRRFFCRPSGSSLPSGFVLGATGLVAPKPFVAK